MSAIEADDFGISIPDRVDPYGDELRDETVELSLEYLKVRDAYFARINPYRAEIPVSIDPTVLSFPVLHTGDTHLSHDHSNPDALGTAVEEAIDLGAILVLHGNIIDAVSDKFLNTNTIHVAMDLDAQKNLAHALLHPALVRGIVIAIGKNGCHEGWSEKKATHDPLPGMVDPTTPLLFSGGQIIFVDAESGEEIGVAEGYHNAGKGRTNQSPEGSARERARSVPDTDPYSPDEVIEGHMHQLFSAQDTHRNPVTGEDVTKAYGQVGAAKGSKDNPDTFLIKLGVPPRLQPADAGHGLVSIYRRHDATEKFTPYPVAGIERAKLLYSAIKLWESVTAAGALDEFRSRIYERCPVPTVVHNEEKSVVRPHESAAKSEGQAPIYKALDMDIQTSLPIRVSAIGNLRIGSNSFLRQELQQMLSDIEANPWAFFVATRRLVNQGVPIRSDRLEILEDLADVLAPALSSLFAVMMTDEMQNKGWAKVIRTTNGDEEAEEETGSILGTFEDLMQEIKEGRIDADTHMMTDILYPGDWLHYDSPIKGTPLIFSETTMRLNVGINSEENTPFTLYWRDQLGYLTSLINPFHGLTRVAQVWGIEADALIGGHIETIGWRTWLRPWGQLEVVVPGGFSEFIEKGIGNRTDYPLGGQGIILIPGTPKMLFSYASHRDGKDFHDALLLQEGLRQMGVLEKTRKKLRKKK